MLSRGKIAWLACFGVLFLCSPLLLRDFQTLENAIVRGSSAEFWYDGQLHRELLRLKISLIEARQDLNDEKLEEVSFKLDMAWSRINALPFVGENRWESIDFGRFAELPRIRAELEGIDAALPLAKSDPKAFIEKALAHTERAVTYSRELSLSLNRRENVRVGELQGTVNRFGLFLVFYAGGFTALIMSLAYLLFRHVRSERELRGAYGKLEKMTSVLREEHEKAVRASEAKTNFLANISHELRTPLNAIIGFSETLLEELFGRLNDKQREYTRDIHASGQHLLGLINDILDLSKIERGKYELDEEAVDLSQVVVEALRTQRRAARDAKITIINSVATDLPAVLAERRRIRQIIDNLVSNAIKFTEPNGQIRVSAAREADGGIRLTVQDTGIGIEAEQIPRVFNAFEQVGDLLARPSEGTGLGLPLVKALTELHQGRVSIESQRWKGTTVTVVLPPSRVRGACQRGSPKLSVAQRAAS